MNNNVYDILIVGAGMVGTTLALSLSSLPIRIALIENSPLKVATEVDVDGRSLALTYGSIQILQTLNIWKNLESFAAPIQTVHISERGRFGITRIKASQENVPALGYVIPAQILGFELNKALLSLSTSSFSPVIERSDTKDISSKNFVLFNPAKVKALCALTTENQPTKQNDNINWQVELEVEHEIQTVRAKLIIAADGTHSTIRNLLNISTQEKDYMQSAIATSITTSLDHNHVAYERFTEHGALAFLPLQNKRGGLVWTADQVFIQNLQSLSNEEFLVSAQKYFGYRLGKFLQVGKRYIYPLRMLYAQEQVRNGLVLIGNAAHTLHPIAAQGFNLGLIDVALLTKQLKQAIDNKHDISAVETLKIYYAEQQQMQQKIMKFTDRLTYLFANDFLPLALARNISLLALDVLPSLKHRLAKRLMGLKVN